MSVIRRGRTRGGYLTVENEVLDGLLEVGSVELAGFYTALKRFIDRRDPEETGKVMNWSVEAFCAKFRVSKDRFYRLAGLLWSVGLIDVEKEITGTGWRNQYVVHEYPDYEGPVRVSRLGTFAHPGKKRRERGIPEIGTPPGIPESGIGGIPKIGIGGIPESGITNKQQILEKTTDQKISSLSFSYEKEREDRSPFSHTEPDAEVPVSYDGPPSGRREESLTDTGGEKASSCRCRGTDPDRGDGPHSPTHTGGKEKSPSLQSEKPAVTNGELIAELAEKLHGIEGIEPLKGHYQLVGKAYREYGYDVVCEAIDDLEIEIIARRRFGEPFSERDLWAMLLAKCKWVSKPKPKPEEKKEEAEEKDPWGPSVPFWDLYEKTPDGRIVAKFDGIPPEVEIVGDVAVVRKRVVS